MKEDNLIEDLLGIAVGAPKSYAEQEWEGMPEYSHEDMTSDSHIVLHFRNNKDREAFSELIGQPISIKTKSLWYPMLDKRYFEDKRYISEEKLIQIKEITNES